MGPNVDSSHAGARSASIRDAWNRCRFVAGSADGHYESYFLRANHPTRPLAFWIRYTVFAPKGRPGDAVGELWAIWFDGEKQRTVAAKQDIPIASCRFAASGLDVHIGEATLVDGQAAGSASSGARHLQWNLRWLQGQAPLLLLPESFYERGFPKAKALVARPNAVFSGELIVDGEPIDIEHWVGSQNHNWGSQHTDSYAWGQVAEFDDAPGTFLECSTARLKLGPFWTPPLSVLVLRLEDRQIRLNSLGQAFRAKGSFDFTSWRIESHAPGVRVALHVHAPPAAFVGLTYRNPPGGSKTCLNSKLASCEVRVEQDGHAPRELVSRHRAAFEVLTERGDHGVPVVV
jgi:hypothetical protein